MDVRLSTKQESDFILKLVSDGSFTIEQINGCLLSGIRAIGRSQLAEQRRQTAMLARIDERLKRNGLSLAKRNRK